MGELLRLSEASEEDFFALHSEANGLGWCRCVAWWVTSWQGFGERSAEQNEALRRSLFERGEHDGYLLKAEGQAVAWCQVGPRDRLSKLADEFGLVADRGAWALSCLAVAPSRRRQGLAREMLTGLLQDLRERGVKRVEAFPPRTESCEEAEQWTGPEALFESLGFLRAGESERRRLMRLDLTAE